VASHDALVKRRRWRPSIRPLLLLVEAVASPGIGWTRPGSRARVYLALGHAAAARDVALGEPPWISLPVVNVGEELLSCRSREPLRVRDQLEPVVQDLITRAEDPDRPPGRCRPAGAPGRHHRRASVMPSGATTWYALVGRGRAWWPRRHTRG
jgi:hypothetical protein